MGNQDSLAVKDASVFLLHPRFPLCTLEKDTQLIKVDISIQNIREVRKWELALESIRKKNCPYLLLPFSYEIVTLNTMCGKDQIAKIIFPAYQYPFEQELQNRYTNDIPFEEAQLWYLLYALVFAANTLSEFNLKIGDVRPLNIFTNQLGQIAILNVFSFPEETTNFQKTLLDQELTFLAPEELELVQNHNSFSQFYSLDHILAQTFSIGLTVLAAALGLTLKDLYSWQSLYHPHSNFPAKSNPLLALNANLLQHYLTILKLSKLPTRSNLNNGLTKSSKKIQYSSDLTAVLEGMCQLDPKKRLSSLKVFTLLGPYKNYILGQRPFKIGLSPIQNSIENICPTLSFLAGPSFDNFEISKENIELPLQKRQQLTHKDKNSINLQHLMGSHNILSITNQHPASPDILLQSPCSKTLGFLQHQINPAQSNSRFHESPKTDRYLASRPLNYHHPSNSHLFKSKKSPCTFRINQGLSPTPRPLPGQSFPPSPQPPRPHISQESPSQIAPKQHLHSNQKCSKEAKSKTTIMLKEMEVSDNSRDLRNSKLGRKSREAENIERDILRKIDEQILASRTQFPPQF